MAAPCVRRHAEVVERKTAHPVNLQIYSLFRADWFLAVFRVAPSSQDRKPVRVEAAAPQCECHF
jgi:hypothetical protein